MGDAAGETLGRWLSPEDPSPEDPPDPNAKMNLEGMSYVEIDPNE